MIVVKCSKCGYEPKPLEGIQGRTATERAPADWWCSRCKRWNDYPQNIDGMSEFDRMKAQKDAIVASQSEKQQPDFLLNILLRVRDLENGWHTDLDGSVIGVDDSELRTWLKEQIDRFDKGEIQSCESATRKAAAMQEILDEMATLLGVPLAGRDGEVLLARIKELVKAEKNAEVVNGRLARIIDCHRTWKRLCAEAQEYNAKNKGGKLGPMCPPPLEERERLDRAIEAAWRTTQDASQAQYLDCDPAEAEKVADKLPDEVSPSRMMHAHAILLFRTTRAHIRVVAMLAANGERDGLGQAPAYRESDILGVLNEECLESNQIIRILGEV